MKKIIIGIIIVLGLGFAYYAISPFFRNVKLDEKISEQIASEVKEGTKAQPVTGTPGHPASGTVRIVSIEGKKHIRYENYKTINGPDIYVYLSKDKEAKEYIEIAKVKATEGNINYEIPEGINVEEYPYVLTWCKAFGVLFNYALIESN